MDGFVKSVSVVRIRQQSDALLDLAIQCQDAQHAIQTAAAAASRAPAAAASRAPAAAASRAPAAAAPSDSDAIEDADTSAVDLASDDAESSDSEPVVASKPRVSKLTAAAGPKRSSPVAATSAESDALEVLTAWSELPVDDVSVRDSGALEMVETLAIMKRLPREMLASCESLLHKWASLRSASV
jgi:hypothetical protein